jgi:hypothetical protein
MHNSNIKSIIDQKLNKLSFEIETHQGTKNVISISNTKNNMAITQNLISNKCRVFSCGSKPHSYADSFSDSGFCLTKKYDKLIINTLKKIENIINIKIPVYSILIKELFSDNIKLALLNIKIF